MKYPPELKALVLGLAAGLLAVSVALAAGKLFAHPSASSPPTAALAEAPPLSALATQGHKLYLMNCAHCHAEDATGDEGPDLHELTKSDARIAAIIKGGVKGEMPKFEAKLGDADISALTAFLRSLK